MTVGYADPAELDEQCRAALVMAADTLRVDFARDACRLRQRDVLDAGSTIAEHLPAKHRLRYTRSFAFDFLGALYVVLDRLADRGSGAPICATTAQELAFRALIETAALFCEGDDRPLWDFYEDRVEDLDIESLFDAALDGVESPDAHAFGTDPVNLDFDDWFVPFHGAWPAPSSSVEG